MPMTLFQTKLDYINPGTCGMSQHIYVVHTHTHIFFFQVLMTESICYPLHNQLVLGVVLVCMCVLKETGRNIN